MEMAQKRRDPKRRRRQSHEGDRWALTNRDPSRHYCWVSTADNVMGPGHFKAGGYETEVQTEGGVMPAIGRTVKDGEEITNSGHVLMSIDKEEWEAIQQEGMFGDAGQDWADKVDRRKFRREGPVDRWQGHKGRIGSFRVAQIGEQ